MELRIESLALVLERGEGAIQGLDRSIFLVDFALENSDHRFVVGDIGDSSGFLLGESKVILVDFLGDGCNGTWLKRGGFGCDCVLFTYSTTCQSPVSPSNEMHIPQPC